MTSPLSAVGSDPFCYLTTTGRRSGADHTIEIWFATDGSSLVLISGGDDRSDWVRNLRADPRCRIRVGEARLDAIARLPLPDGRERDRAVELLHEKYGREVAATLQDWRRDAFVVALDLKETP